MIMRIHTVYITEVIYNFREKILETMIMLLTDKRIKV